MNQPFISVIIPAYNVENCIDRAIKSVFQQKINEIEIIIVDDCSTDGTWDRIQKWVNYDKRVTALCLSHRSKPSGARNAALKIAKGEYIHFCDSDDAVPSNSYINMLKVARAQNADIVTGNYMRMYPNQGGVVRPFTRYSAPSAIGRCFEQSNTTLWNKLFRRTFIEKNRIRFDETMRYMEDLLFFMEYMKADPKPAYTNANVYIYTEPTQNAEVDEGIKGVQRFANIICMKDGMYSYEKVFGKQLTANIALWQDLYCTNLNWHYQCVYRPINSPKEKEEAYQAFKDGMALCAKANPGVLDWTELSMAQRFVDMMNMDFQTFQTLTYHEFLILDSIRARGTYNMCGWNLPYLENGIDQAIQQNWLNFDKDCLLTLKQRIEDLKERYDRPHPYQQKAIQAAYWEEWRQIFRQSWAPIQDILLKEEGWNLVRNAIAALSENEVCSLISEYSYWTIRDIFGVDYPTMATLDYQEYILATSLHKIEPEDVSAERVRELIVSRSKTGDVRLRDLIKASIGWVRYKTKKIMKIEKT